MCKLKYITCLLTMIFWFMTASFVFASSQPMMMVKGKALKAGDTIGIAGPASPVTQSDFSVMQTRLHNMGYNVKFANHALKNYGTFAGNDEERAADIMAMFHDDEVKAILCLRGGYGSARILDKLDYEWIKAHPKLLIGYSDITSLHVALNQKAGLVTAHAPMAIVLNNPAMDNYSLEQLIAGIQNNAAIGEVTLPQGTELKTVVSGNAQGRIIGGNLTNIAALCGTPYELKGEGNILFIEETDEYSYNIDRMLQQLYQNGLLTSVNGIVYGDFTDCPTDDGDFSTTEVLNYYAKLSGKPVIKGLPAGHGRHNMFLPLGVSATLKANINGKASLSIDESALQ